VLAPELAPLSQLGVPDFELEVWDALVAPATLPAPAQARLAGIVASIMQTPEVRQNLFAQGWQAVGAAPEGLARRIQQESALLGNIIRARGIRLE